MRVRQYFADIANVLETYVQLLTYVYNYQVHRYTSETRFSVVRLRNPQRPVTTDSRAELLLDADYVTNLVILR